MNGMLHRKITRMKAEIYEKHFLEIAVINLRKECMLLPFFK